MGRLWLQPPLVLLKVQYYLIKVDVRWEGGAAFMILELGFILTDYVRQLSFLCISHFPGNGSYTWPGTFDRSPLGTQCPTLVCTLRKLQEGRRITGPSYWACAQGRYGARPRACMGLGSRCRTIGTGPRACMGLGSRCCTYLKINKRIVALKNWVSGRVFLFCKQYFSAS